MLLNRKLALFQIYCRELQPFAQNFPSAVYPESKSCACDCD